jgi:hypothetical protein
LIGAGTVINPIIKVVTTVAILAAVGIFIVKPVLETTEDLAATTGANVRDSIDSVNRSISNAQIDSMRTQIAGQIQGFASTWPEAARELRDCARDAGRDGLRLERCTNFADKVRGMVSDRNFATSYASSLSAQGDTAASDRIEKCVDDAGYTPAAMGKCRRLADQLLFG